VWLDKGPSDSNLLVQEDRAIELTDGRLCLVPGLVLDQSIALHAVGQWRGVVTANCLKNKLKRLCQEGTASRWLTRRRRHHAHKSESDMWRLTHVVPLKPRA
jgi:type IV secretory pathway TrbD component